jgi:hypothetical protein
MEFLNSSNSAACQHQYRCSKCRNDGAHWLTFAANILVPAVQCFCFAASTAASAGLTHALYGFDLYEAKDAHQTNPTLAPT